MSDVGQAASFCGGIKSHESPVRIHQSQMHTIKRELMMIRLNIDGATN